MRKGLALSLLLLPVLLAGCGASSKDSDGDGLKDRTERSGWVRLKVDFIDRRSYVDVSSDPASDDTDGDGLTDFDEFFQRTDPRSNDTDEDGLSDCQELLHTVRALCEDPSFTGPYDNGTGTNPARADSDAGPSRYVNGELGFVDEVGDLPSPLPFGDGIPDGQELAGYSVTLGNGHVRFVRTDPRLKDSDGDQLEDGEEGLLFASDPEVPDTDGDGCEDGRDPVPSREERLRLGLQSFRLDRDGGASLQLEGELEGRPFRAPATGTVEVETGVEEDLAPHDPAAAPPAECSLYPRHPWAKVQVFAFDRQGSALVQLDIVSQSGAPASDPSRGATVYWNLQTGRFAWTGTGEAPFDGPLRLAGADGELRLAPLLA